jgi:hypothetical protein
MKRLAWLPAILLSVAAAVVALAPGAIPSPSAAAFTDTESAQPNVITVTACTASSWATAINALATGSNRLAWQRLGISGSQLSADVWTGDAWTDSGLALDQPGAPGCDPDRGVLLDAGTDSTWSPARSYGAWSANATSTALLWVKGSTQSGGRLLTLGEGNAVGSTWVDRSLWVTSTGNLGFGTKWDTNAASEWWVTTSDVNVSDGAWHLIVAVMTASGAADGVELFVDGRKATTTANGSPRYRATTNTTTSARWYLGTNNAGRAVSIAPMTAFLGTYDDFVTIAGRPTATQLGAGSGSLWAAGHG